MTLALQLLTFRHTGKGTAGLSLRHCMLVLSLAAVGFSTAGCEAERRRWQYIDLRSEYLNPRYSDAFNRYWRIDLANYRHRLVQDYVLAEAQAEGLTAMAGSVDDMMRYQERLMTNWLEEELILRDLMRIQAGNDSHGPGESAIGKDTLPEQMIIDEIGDRSSRYRQYREWVNSARAGRPILQSPPRNEPP